MTTPYCVFWSLFFREKVDKGFIDACIYVKDRMEEVSSPDKEMVRIPFCCFYYLCFKKNDALVWIIVP